MKIKYLILVIMLLTGFIFAQTSKNMQMLDQKFATEFYTAWADSERFGGGWGYTDQSTGDKYFYLGTSRGMAIFDVTNPSNISDTINTITVPAGVTHLKNYGKYLYTTPVHLKNNVVIYDLDDPFEPDSINYIPVDSTLDIKMVHDLFIEDGVLYLACLSNTASQGDDTTAQLFMYDLRDDPDDPVRIGSWVVPRHIPQYISTWMPGIGEVSVKDNRIYCAAGNSGAIVATFYDSTGTGGDLHRIIDEDNTWVITYKNLRNDTSSTSFRLTHTVKATDDHNYIFVCDETLEKDYYPDSTDQGAVLRLFDISNIENFNPISDTVNTANFLNPTQIYEVPEDSTDGEIWSSNNSLISPNYPVNSIHKVRLFNNFAYIGYYSKGIRILDISDVENWVEVAYFDTPDSVNTPKNAFYTGAWSVYPYFGNDQLLVPDFDDFITYKFGENGTLPSSTSWSGTKYITADLTVPQGDTLTINAGSEIKFSKDVKLTVRGVLKIKGVSNNPVTIHSMSDDSEGYGIYAVDSPEPMGTKVDLNYCIIEDLDVGLEANRAIVDVSNTIIKNCGVGISLINGTQISQVVDNDSITGCNYGMYIDNAAPTVSDNKIMNCKYNGIVIESGEGEYSGNMITNCGGADNQYIGAFYATDGSAPFLQLEEEDALNDISSNKGFGLRADDYTTIYAGEEEVDGGNEISDNDTYDARAHESSTIYAINNYWGTDEVSSGQFTTSGESEIYYEPWLEKTPIEGLEINCDLNN